jgi:SPP1 family predicted phage head-tail adaptor
MIQAGEMRNDIIVQRKTTIKDNYGAEADIFTDTLYLKAAVKYNSGNRGLNNEEVFNSRNITFTTYYRSITESMRILFNDKKYKITFISVIGYNEGLSINTELINE